MDAIHKVIDAKRHSHKRELEIRLGHFKLQKFATGIAPNQWSRILSSLHKYDGWANKSDYITRVDYFYPGGYRLTKVFKDQKPPTLIKKHKVKHADISLGNGFCCRIACSCEDDKDISHITDEAFNYVRLKHMCTFTTNSGFRFDISRVWEANTLSHARQMVEAKVNGSCEVEIELIDPNYVTKHDNVYIADSMLIKMKDLVAQFELSDA